MCAAVVAVAVLFFVVSIIAEYRPAPVEELYSDAMPEPLPDTVVIVTWNIGYAGLGADMDFFYDGGRRVRDTRGQTRANLENIIATLKDIDADIMLLQEVDLSSRRSYGMDQAAVIEDAFPGYTAIVGLNYKAWFVPVPLRDPMGKVRSGVMTLSRFRPADAKRYDYPSRFGFPQRMFNLKRGVLSTRFITYTGDTVMVNNTHNTAYDRGGMRTAEMRFLGDMLLDAASRGTMSVTGGDWNQYPPQYVPSQEELANEYFVPEKADGKYFSSFADFVYDPSAPTLRYLDKPYSQGDVTTVTDFFIVSRGVRLLSVRTLDLGFENSDHNPVVLTIAF